MTSYRLFGSNLGGNGYSGPSTAVSFSGNFLSGIGFGVKGGGKWFEGYWWWVAPSGQSTSPVKCALWSVVDNTADGDLVPGSVVTSGALTAGQWNYIPLPLPVPLAPSWDSNSTPNGSTYIAAIGVNGNFPDDNNYFASGNPGGNGITNGPLIAYASNSVGTTNVSPLGPNGVFSTGGSDPSLVIPTAGSNNGDNFGVDVQITDVAPAGYIGGVRLYPNKAGANKLSSGDAAVNYTVATEIHLTETCTLKAIWYFRPNGATTMATRCDVWNIATGLSVASITAPVWLDSSGAAFANRPSGIGTWAQAQFPAGVTLGPGSYRVSVYNSAGTSDINWSAKDATSDYFGETYPGAGSDGIDWDVISAPNWAGAAAGYLYGGASTNTPAYSNGTTPHAQPVFGQGASGECVFPQLNAPVGGGTNETQNYWVDLEVMTSPKSIDFTVDAASFNPVIELVGGSAATATWEITSGGTGTFTGLAPAITGLTAPATVKLTLVDGDFDKLAADLLTIDLGFDHTQDAGTYAISSSYDKAAEQVTGISGLNQATALTIFAAANGPLTGTLDLTGMSALEFVECFAAHLTGVNLTGCSSLIRLNIENNNLTDLDLNPVRTTLRDLRAAIQRGGALNFETLTGNMDVEYHFCIRDQIVTGMPPVSRLPVVQQHWIWDTRQTGQYVAPATGPNDSILASAQISATTNAYTSADLRTVTAGQVDLSGNSLKSVQMPTTGNLGNINFSDNNLDVPQIDAILAAVDALGISGGTLNLSKNKPPSPAGQAHVTALQGRGWAVTVDTLSSRARSAGVLMDDFNRADATGLAGVGNGWFTPGGFAAAANISGGNLVRTDSAAYQILLNTGGGLLPEDYTVFARFPGATLATNYNGIVGRWDKDLGNGIQCFFDTTRNVFHLCAAASFEAQPEYTLTTLNSFPASWSNNSIDHEWAMEFRGTTVTIYADGVAVFRAVNVLHNVGKQGTCYGINGEGNNKVYYSIGARPLQNSLPAAI